MGVAANAPLTMMIECSTSRNSTMELKWLRTTTTIKSTTNKNLLFRPPIFPIYISTDPHHVDPLRLRDLCGTCHHSFHRFPSHVTEDQPLLVDTRKLRIALSHSAVVVSVFCKSHHVLAAADSGDDGSFGMDDLVECVTPVTPSDGELVGFGRAVSDCGLTASIYDVMVIPSLRRMGIGRVILKRIVRMLINRGVYDIAALCTENERFQLSSTPPRVHNLIPLLFFKACGFGGDILGSTTMMYTRTASSTAEEELTFTRAGRKLLLIPPLKS
ncbi:hypothetical protein Ahy_B10g104041 [Arachis hypogaea]|uniref:N-acetyltransferase domain-containing protein n=1 Tax=Arachis hypogaea TaxID=3818 RepID=A0A444X4K5_ARAHY|nr:hypothetical protein Ahy_B10g104041 [Arachis hypogaea]